MSVVIEVEDIGKLYRLGEVGTGTLSHDIKRWMAKRLGKEDPYTKVGSVNDRTAKSFSNEYVWALKDINFRVCQGDILGIIGKNGAGKSTLLKILSRITAPSKGSVKIRGRVASLLEVGTGFHPELTGRENVYLNGSILGMRKAEIRQKFDEIIHFSGVEKYVNTPVKRYSSGMYVRLAFAVAAHLDPEILIVDEVLAVGDSEFQKKAMGKMKDISQGSGRTVLFVSHNMGAISQLCHKAILLVNGRILSAGSVEGIVKTYLQSSFSQNSHISFNRIAGASGQISDVKLKDESGMLCRDFPVGFSPILEIEYILNTSVRGFHVAVILTDDIGNHIYSTADTDINPVLLGRRDPGTYKVRLRLPIPGLNVGRYNISVGMGIINSDTFHRVEALSFNIVDVGDFGTGKEELRRRGLLLVEGKWQYL